MTARIASLSVPGAFAISVAIVVGGACAPPATLDGEIDGETVPPFSSAFFAQTAPVNGGEGELLVVEAFTFPDACALAAEQLLAIDDIEEGVAFHTEKLPSDYWNLSISIQAEDLAGLVGEDIALGDVSGASVTVTHVKNHPTIDDNGLLQLDQVRAGESGGTLQIASLSEDASVALTADIELEYLADAADGPTGSAGAPTAIVNASACQAYEDAFVDSFNAE